MVACNRVGVVLLGVIACGCAANTPDNCIDGRASINEPAPDDDMHAAQRHACAFGPSMTTDMTLGGSGAPAIPDTIKHVIIVMHENHSFDQYLGDYVHTDRSQVNFDPMTGQDVAPFHETRYCVTDANHEWGAAHLAFDNGHLDGFVANADDTDGTGGTMLNEGGGARVMGYYTAEDLPFYYWLASNFAISDHYFSSILGPTHANLMFYYRATSCDVAEGFDTQPKLSACGNALWPDFDSVGTGESIFDGFASGDAKVYTDSTRAPVSAAAGLLVFNPLKIGTIADFEADVAANHLPSLVFVEPDYGKWSSMENDEHPPTNIQLGQNLSYRVVSAVMAKPEIWSSSVMFLTWDENGGWYDHVRPPRACAPDDNYAPVDFGFDNYGFRVPLIVVSPYARKGYISSYTADHTSLVRFVEHWRHRGAMTKRDANAWPLLDMFDFTQSVTTLTPDAALGAISADPAHIGTCNSHGGTGMP